MIVLKAAQEKILAALQEDGRLSSQALAERVGLSTSPCWRRVRRLEAEGVIRATVALVDAVPAGLYARAALASLGLWDIAEARLAQSSLLAALARSALADQNWPRLLAWRRRTA